MKTKCKHCGEPIVLSADTKLRLKEKFGKQELEHGHLDCMLKL